MTVKISKGYVFFKPRGIEEVKPLNLNNVAIRKVGISKLLILFKINVIEYFYWYNILT